MLRGIPGIAVGPVGALGYQVAPSIPGSNCGVQIYLDGHALPRSINTSYDDLNSYVWTDWVVGIEVYPHGTGAPAEYTGGWGFCPVVLIWTSSDADVLDRESGGGQ